MDSKYANAVAYEISCLDNGRAKFLISDGNTNKIRVAVLPIDEGRNIKQIDKRTALNMLGKSCLIPNRDAILAELQRGEKVALLVR